MNIKNHNSILAFLFRFICISVVLDYLLWPRVIKVSESIDQGLQVKLMAGIGCLFFSVYFLLKSKKIEQPNLWQKISTILSLITSLVFVGSILFYLYIEMTK